MAETITPTDFHAESAHGIADALASRGLADSSKRLHDAINALVAERDDARRDRDVAQKANRELAEHIVNLNQQLEDAQAMLGE